MAKTTDPALSMIDRLGFHPHAKRQNIYALILVFILELLWVRLDSSGVYSPGAWRYVNTTLSAGFPFRAVSFTIRQTEGKVPQFKSFPESSRWKKWTPFTGYAVYPLSQVLTLFSALVLFFAARWLLKFELACKIERGVIVGVVFGILTSLATQPSARIPTGDPVNWTNGFLALIALPSAICIMSRNSKTWRDPLLLLAVIVAVYPWTSLWCDQFKPFYRFGLGASSRAILEPDIDTFLSAIFLGLLVGLVVFLMRISLPIFKGGKPSA